MNVSAWVRSLLRSDLAEQLGTTTVVEVLHWDDKSVLVRDTGKP